LENSHITTHKILISRCFVLVLNFDSCADGRIWTESVQEQGAKENNWIQDEELKGGYRKLSNEEVLNLYSSLILLRRLPYRRQNGKGTWRT
jgi:hypothetical protein